MANFNKQLTSGSAEEERRGAALLERERERGREGGREGEGERVSGGLHHPGFDLSSATLLAWNVLDSYRHLKRSPSSLLSLPPSHSFSPQQASGPKETPGEQTTSSCCALLGELDSHH